MIWNKNYSRCALIFKAAIVITDKNLKVLIEKKVLESILSAYFDENDVLIYSTHKSLKYVMIDGSIGILMSTPAPTYVI